MKKDPTQYFTFIDFIFILTEDVEEIKKAIKESNTGLIPSTEGTDI